MSEPSIQAIVDADPLSARSVPNLRAGSTTWPMHTGMRRSPREAEMERAARAAEIHPVA
jgi:hypothetical protein